MKRKIAIGVENLTRRFNGLTAVGGISFKVFEGEIFAFLGPNGAGKSTTIKMLTTLLHPSDGEARIAGYEVVNDSSQVRRAIGVVFQDTSLDEELTAGENMELHGVLYGLTNEERKKRTRELLEMVDLWGRKDELVKKFSGGMKRRLEIARGLLHRPKVLFLDEPTLGLDPQTRRKIWDYIRDLNMRFKMTIFFTTHYMEEAARMAGRIAIIDRGKIVALGSPGQLRKQTGKKTLEAAFIELTGREIREEEAGGHDRMREFIRRRQGGRG